MSIKTVDLLSDLSNEIDGLEDQIIDLKDYVEELQGDLTNSENYSCDLEETVKDMESDIEALEIELGNLK